jgi:hypothetical protein
MCILFKIIIATVLASVSFLGGLYLGMLVDDAYLWIVLTVPIASAMYLGRLRCERCGKLVFRHEGMRFGVKWTYWGYPLGRIPMSCNRCGHSFC